MVIAPGDNVITTLPAGHSFKPAVFFKYGAVAVIFRSAEHCYFDFIGFVVFRVLHTPSVFIVLAFHGIPPYALVYFERIVNKLKP